MKLTRRKFLKFLGIGSAAAIAPVVVAKAIPKPFPPAAGPNITFTDDEQWGGGIVTRKEFKLAHRQANERAYQIAKRMRLKREMIWYGVIKNG